MAETRPGLSGLEYFQKMMAGDFTAPPFLAMLGFSLTEAEAGRVVFSAAVKPEHYNGQGVAHGGFAASLLDTALGCCINTMMPAGKRFTTLELKINLTRPLTTSVGLLRCEARIVHLGGRVATSEGRIVDQNGKLYAHGTTTCIVVEAPRGALEP